LVNGIAYTDKQVYTLVLDRTTIAGVPTTTTQLAATVKMNGLTVTRNVVWSSSAVAKATVSSTGLVTLVANGTATITCSLEGDASVNDTVAVTVSSTPSDIYEVIITPSTNYVLEGETETYTVYLYKNGNVQAGTFTYSVNTRTVSTYDYVFTPSANGFTIHNTIKCLTDYITVTCTSGSYNGTLDVYFKGSW
jgi:hypothetical protein